MQFVVFALAEDHTSASCSSKWNQSEAAAVSSAGSLPRFCASSTEQWQISHAVVLND
jgi:hypothetical protein